MILSSVKGTTAVAIYNVGSSFKGYFQNFSTSISSVFSPQVNQIVAQNRPMKELDEIFIRIGRIQFYVVSLVLIGYCSIGHSFVRLWAGMDYSDSFYIGLLLMIAVAVPAFQNVGLEIQKAKNMHKARSVVYFLVALINIGLTIPMSQQWEGIGAAFATMICMFMGTVVFMNIYYWKKVGLDIPKFWKSIASILPGYCAPVLVGVLIWKFFVIDSYSDVLIAALVIGAVFLLSIWRFSMNNYEKNLLRRPVKKGFKFIYSKVRIGA